MVIKWSYHLKRKMPQIVSTPTSSSGYVTVDRRCLWKCIDSKY
jgi:hypothetical protein